MERKKASDFDQELLDLYDGYAHGQISKRAFFDGAAKFAVGGLTVAALVESLMPNYALAQQVDPEDPSIETERMTYESADGHGTINGYLVKPAGASGPLPCVIVVHENRGLNPYIEDVARRLGTAGFMALAPDGLTPLGGYPGTDDEGKAMQKQLDRAKLAEDFFAAFEHLMAHGSSNGKVGVVGFCYGGGISNAMAVRYPELAASVPFYGRQASAEDVPQIEARCCCTMLVWISGSMRAGQPMRPRSRSMARNTQRIFTQRSITAFITTPPLVMTKPRPSSPGTGRSPSSMTSWWPDHII